MSSTCNTFFSLNMLFQLSTEICSQCQLFANRSQSFNSYPFKYATMFQHKCFNKLQSFNKCTLSMMPAYFARWKYRNPISHTECKHMTHFHSNMRFCQRNEGWCLLWTWSSMCTHKYSIELHISRFLIKLETLQQNVRNLL